MSKQTKVFKSDTHQMAVSVGRQEGKKEIVNFIKGLKIEKRKLSEPTFETQQVITMVNDQVNYRREFTTSELAPLSGWDLYVIKKSVEDYLYQTKEQK